MGHRDKDAHSCSYNHRLLLLTHRRIESFILIFTVILISWMILLGSEHDTVSKCQHRVNQARYQYVLSPNLTFEEIMSTVNTALASMQVKLNFNADATNGTRIVNAMDTDRDLLSRSNFYLLLSEEYGSFRWTLHTYTPDMCSGSPPVSMEVLPNVDYEKAQYRSDAVMIPHILNTTHHFMLCSTLITKDPDRISSFVQLESVFPGLYALSSADDSIVAKEKYLRRDHGEGELYFNSAALDITVQVQQWKGDGEKASFWSILLYTTSIYSEEPLKSLHRSLESSFLANNMFCSSKACVRPETIFLS